MNKQELKILQALPLDVKILKSKQRIREFIEYYGTDNVYISFSGGKDSTVLLHLVRQEYPNIQAVYIDTGLEYPEVKSFIKTFENVLIIRPKLTFKQVLNKYGYPVVSKEQAQYLYDIRHGTEKMRLRRLNGDSKGRFKLSKKYHYLINAPFEISEKCCNVMKKAPAKEYEKITGKKPIIGVMAVESTLRQNNYIKNGCNSFNAKRPKSEPLGFWTEQDVLTYLLTYNIAIPSVYGDIIQDENGIYKTTLCDRTGCVFCAFGMEQERKLEENRFQRLKRTHPNLYDYCINALGFKEVFEYMKIKYE